MTTLGWAVLATTVAGVVAAVAALPETRRDIALAVRITVEQWALLRRQLDQDRTRGRDT